MLPAGTYYVPHGWSLIFLSLLYTYIPKLNETESYLLLSLQITGNIDYKQNYTKSYFLLKTSRYIFNHLST